MAASFPRKVAVIGVGLISLSNCARIKRTEEGRTEEFGTLCPTRPPIPGPPATATAYNGISWPAYCFEGDEVEHLFIIGDWGGLDFGGKVKPAPNTGYKRFHKRGLDDRAQHLVAAEMSKLAERVKPRLVLAGGDNFYWGGIKDKCGKPIAQAIKDFNDPKNEAKLQFEHVFETMYHGTVLSTVPWLNCFGNHDYGGFQFNAAWDQQIAYTWGPTKRWVLPGQYWHQRIDYPSKKTSIDAYFVDTCNQDTTNPRDDAMHNICSRLHNKGANCAPFGPSNAYHCVGWFRKLWRAQLKWMNEKICASTADWQVIVTHFPPEPYTHYKANVNDWRSLGVKCGIDLFVGSHRHDQEMHQNGYAGIPYLVAGGGGGITSEHTPADNTQYGFFDMIVTKTSLSITSLNQFGNVKGTMILHPRDKAPTNLNGTALIEEFGEDVEDPPGLTEYTLASFSEKYAGNDAMPANTNEATEDDSDRFTDEEMFSEFESMES